VKFSEAEQYISSLERFGIKLGLERIEKLLELVGNPQTKLKFVHVAGTNGKGSTATMIASILKEAGYKVGLYTSPHIRSYRERISVNGSLITEERFAKIVSDISAVAEKCEGEYPTEFEVLTAVSLLFFYEAGVDIAVMEVGMGGRFDATNVITIPEVSVITNVSRDHMEYLGSDVRQIALEKAGIIREQGILVTAASDPEVREILQQKCREKNARFLHVGDEINLKKGKVRAISGKLVQECSLRGRILSFDNLMLSMIGGHQIVNAATALLAVEVLLEKGYSISAINARLGLEKSRCPARIEVFNLSPLILLDVAHNREGIRMLKRVLCSDLKVKRLVLVTGMLDDKEWQNVAEIWGALPAAVVVTRPDSRRVKEWEQLARCFRRYTGNVYLKEEIEQAVTLGLKMVGPEDCLCVAGSFYIIDRARRKLSALLSPREQ